MSSLSEDGGADGRCRPPDVSSHGRKPKRPKIRRAEGAGASVETDPDAHHGARDGLTNLVETLGVMQESVEHVLKNETMKKNLEHMFETYPLPVVVTSGWTGMATDVAATDVVVSGAR